MLETLTEPDRDEDTQLLAELETFVLGLVKVVSVGNADAVMFTVAVFGAEADMLMLAVTVDDPVAETVADAFIDVVIVGVA